MAQRCHSDKRSQDNDRRLSCDVPLLGNPRFCKLTSLADRGGLRISMKPILLSLIAALLLTACARDAFNGVSDSPMSSAAACAAHDGAWVPVRDLYPLDDLSEDDMRRYTCIFQTDDGGKSCTDNRQCHNLCMAPQGAVSGQTATGVCAESTRPKGDVLTIADGKVMYPSYSLEMTERKSSLLEELIVNRDRWDSLGISSYEFTIEQTCFCLLAPYYGPNRIIVRNGSIKTVIYRGEKWDGYKPGDRLTNESTLKTTIDEIFDDLEQRILRLTGNAMLRIEYDEKFGFPTLIDFDRPDWADEEFRKVVSDFSPRE